MILDVNANRMELMRLKKRLGVAQRGHKLLKDKLDELMRMFLEIVHETGRVRDRAERELEATYAEFKAFFTSTPKNNAEFAMSLPAIDWQVTVGIQRILNIKIPDFQVHTTPRPMPTTTLGTPLAFDRYVQKIPAAFTSLVQLAQKEKKIEILAIEIEKTRRRVNALEYILIPNILETLKYIQMKLDELERGNLTRLMKVKQMLGK